MHSVSENLDTAIQQSMELIALAEANDWDHFNELEASRQAIVEEINTADLDPTEVQLTRHKLQQLIELNDQLERVCLAERDAAMTQLRSMKQGAKVSKAYGEK